MADVVTAEKGFRIESETSVKGVDIIRGTGSPVGILDSDVGSIFLDDTGKTWHKIAMGAINWRRLLDTDDTISASDFDTILIDNFADVLVDNEFNVLSSPF